MPSPAYATATPQSGQGQSRPCNYLDSLAYSLDFVSGAATGVQLASGVGGIGAAATGAEPVAIFLEGVAAGSGLVSTGASVLSGVAKGLNGDLSGAFTSFGTAALSFTGARAYQRFASLYQVGVNYKKADLSAAGLAAIAGGDPRLNCGR